MELISDVLGITLHHWPARGVNYSRTELHYISRPVGELIIGCFMETKKKTPKQAHNANATARLSLIVQMQQDLKNTKKTFFP